MNRPREQPPEHGSTATVTFIASALDEAYRQLGRQLEGMTAEEFFWEPVPACWSLRLLEDGRWSLDYGEVTRGAAPLTTIAWRLVHVAACKIMYYEYAFGPGVAAWDDLLLPGTVDGAISWLATGQRRLTAALTGLSDADLQTMRPTNWGEQWPLWRIFWTMVTHDLEHGAEIGLLRQLYRRSRATVRHDDHR